MKPEAHRGVRPRWLALMACSACACAAQVATTLSVSATDDGLPDPSRALTYRWTVAAAPAESLVEFSPNSDVANPVVSFPCAGSYVLLVRVDDGHLGTEQSLTVTVRDHNAPSDAATTASAATQHGGGCGGGSSLACALGAFVVGWRRRLPTLPRR